VISPSGQADATGVRGWSARNSHVQLATVLLALAMGYLVARWPMPSLAVFAVLALALATVLSREFALGAILVSSLLMLSVTSWLGLPVQAALLTKALVGLFALTVVLDLGPGNPLRVPWSLMMLSAVLVVSAVFGAGNRFLAFQALAAYLVAPVAYVAIVHSNITTGSLRRLALVVAAIMIVQLPIVMIQARFIANVDRIGGTFSAAGGTSIQAVVMGVVWTIAVALLFGRRRAWLLPVGLAIAAVLMISQAKAGFLFAALGTAAVGLAEAIAIPKRGAHVLPLYGALSAAAVAALFGAYLYFGRLLPGGQAASGYWTAWLSNPMAIRDYLFSYGSGGQAGRLEGVRLALSRSGAIANLLIGQGLGVLSTSALLGQNVTSSSAYGTSFDWATSATRWLLEVGVMGTLLYIVAIGAAVGAVVKSWARRADELGVAIAAAAVGSAAIYVAAALYAAPWNWDAIAVPFWCLLGMAVKWGRLRDAAPETEQGPAHTTFRRAGAEGDS